MHRNHAVATIIVENNHSGKCQSASDGLQNPVKIVFCPSSMQIWPGIAVVKRHKGFTHQDVVLYPSREHLSVGSIHWKKNTYTNRTQPSVPRIDRKDWRFPFDHQTQPGRVKSHHCDQHMIGDVGIQLDLVQPCSTWSAFRHILNFCLKRSHFVQNYITSECKFTWGILKYFFSAQQPFRNVHYDRLTIKAFYNFLNNQPYMIAVRVSLLNCFIDLTTCWNRRQL